LPQIREVWGRSALVLLSHSAVRRPAAVDLGVRDNSCDGQVTSLSAGVDLVYRFAFLIRLRFESSMSSTPSISRESLSATRELDERHLAEEMAADLRREQDELNSYARHVFSKFVSWWQFFIGAHIVLLTAFQELPSLGRLLSLLAPVIAVFAWLGNVYCFVACCRFVQISSRYNDILMCLYGSERVGDWLLPVPLQVKEMRAMIWKNLFREPTYNFPAPNSPIPLRYYLLCAVAVMPVCTMLGILWLIGWATYQAPPVVQ